MRVCFTELVCKLTELDWQGGGEEDKTGAVASQGLV
jgi:hypothetical protein